MTLIIGTPGAEALAAMLRAADIPVLVRQDNSISEKELATADAAVTVSAAKLKNMRDDLTVYTWGDNERSPFSDGHICTPTELVSVLTKGKDRLFFSCGAAVELTGATAEYNGRTVRFSKSEMRIIKCIHSSSLPLPAELIAESCFGKSNAKSVMTHVWKINKKFSSLTSEKLIVREKSGGYRIN